MAVTTPSNLTNGNSTTSGTTFTTASVSPTGNALLILTVLSMGSASAPAAPTISGNGLTWVQITTLTLGSLGRVTWYRAMGASPSSGTITITHGTTCQACTWSLDQFVGVDTSGSNGSGAVVQASTASGSASTTAAKALSAFSDPDNVLFGSIAHSASEAVTPSSGFSELADRVNGRPGTGAGAIETQWGYAFEDVTFGWSTSTTYALIAIEVASTPGAGYAAGQPTTLPVAILELDLNDQSNPTRNFVDISNRLISGNYKQQRSWEGERVEAGDGAFVCRNHDRALDPTFSTGPYFGKLDADRFIRLRFLWKGRWKNEFVGYLQGIDTSRQNWGEQTVTLQCKNGFDPLAQETMVPSQYTLTTSTGVTNGDLTYIGRGSTTGGQGSAPGPKQGLIFGGLGGGLQGNYSGVTPIPTIAYVSGGSNPPITSDDVGVDESTNAIHVQLQQSTGQAQNIMNAINAHPVASRLVYAKLAPGSNGSGMVGPMSATPLQGGFPQEKSGARINRCLDFINPSWPTADRIIDVGTETIQTLTFEKKDNISALTHMQDVCATELGIVFMDGRNRVVFHGRTHRVGASSVATFSDNPGAGEYAYVDIKPSYDNSKIWNQWTGTMNQPGSSQAVEVTVNDTTSQGKHRIRNQTVTLICAAAASVTTIVNKLLSRYKDQVRRYDSITLGPVSGGSEFDIAFDLDISSCVTVKENPTAGPGISSPTITSTHFIEGYEISFDENGIWKFVYPLSPYSFSQ